MKKSTTCAGALVATSNAPGESCAPSPAEVSDDEASRFLVFGRIAEEVKEAVGTGRQPDVEAYARKHPQWADEIRELVATLGMVNILGPPSRPDEQPGDEAQPHQEPARQLGDFRILREIGRGGMGVVYEAEQVSLSRRVALKTLPFAAVLDDRQIQRFKNEALAAAQLNHPHIVDVYGVGVERGVHYYVMRHIEGSSLAEVIAELRRTGSDDAGKAGRREGRRDRENERECGDAAFSREPASRVSASATADDAAPAHIDDPHAGPGPSTLDPGPFNSALRAPHSALDVPHPTITVDSSTIRRSGPPPASRVAVADTAPVRKLTTNGSHASPQFFRSVARIGIEVAQALDHAHQNGVVHRDIKPSNIMLDGDGKAWVTDFGLCHIETGATLTMTGDLVGTLRYMSPEQALAKRIVIDHRTDIYSLGVTLYELLTLQPAFSGRDRQELLRQVAFDEPKPLRRVNAAVPEELETIILKAIAKSPQERYATVCELGEDVRRFLDDRPILARRPTLRQRGAKLVRRHKAVSATIVLATCLLVILGIVGLLVSHALIAGERDKALDDKQRAERAEERARQHLDEALAAKAETTRLADELARELYVADMNLALNDWEAGNVERVRELLMRHIPGPRDDDRRGFEWYYLWRQYQQSSAAPRMTCDGYIWSMALSPTGETLAAGHYGGVSLWDVASRKLQRRLPTTEKVIHFVAFSPDGKLLATSGPDNSIRLWEVRTGTLVRQLPGHENWVFSLAFSPDGSTIASGSWDKTIKLWEVASGVCLATLEGHPHEVIALAFSPDGRQLASGGWDEGTIRLWDVAAREQSAALESHEDLIISLAFSPDGRTLASASRDKTVRLWDVEARSQRMMLRGFRNWVASVAFSPDGRTVATGDGDNTIQLWDAATGDPTRTLKGHAGAVMGAAFTADGKTLISGSWDRTIRLWDLATPELPSVLKPENLARATRGRHDLQAVDVTSDGAVVAAGGIAGRLHLWNLDTGEPVRTWQAHEHWIADVDFHRDDEILASCSWDHSIKLWKLSDVSQPLASLTEHDGGVQAIAFTPDGNLLASAGRHGTVRLWNVETVVCEAVLRGHSGWVNDLSFSAGGELLASSGDDGTIRIWSVKERRQIHQIPGGDAWITGVRFSPRAQILAVTAFDGTVRLWDVENTQELTVMQGHAAVITAAYSADGKILATGGADYTIKLWDFETGAQRGRLAGHTDDVNALVFSPKGDVLLSASDDGTVRIWRAGKSNEPN